MSVNKQPKELKTATCELMEQRLRFLADECERMRQRAAAGLKPNVEKFDTLVKEVSRCEATLATLYELDYMIFAE